MIKTQPRMPDGRASVATHLGRAAGEAFEHAKRCQRGTGIELYRFPGHAAVDANHAVPAEREQVTCASAWGDMRRLQAALPMDSSFRLALSALSASTSALTWQARSEPRSPPRAPCRLWIDPP